MPLDFEQLKREKDGLAVLDDIHRYAKEGFQAITEDDFFRFKWYGLYQQKPKEEGHFMLRLKIPGGHYDSRQLRTIAGIARDFAHNFGDVTTRQTFQYHWLKIEDVPEIFRRLEDVGISTSGACGDIMRNITGCPVAGIDAKEVFDASPEVNAVNSYFLNNKEYSNLPRKYKLSIIACDVNCTFPQINCLAFVGVPHGPDGVDEEGYNIYIGGGLSTAPHFAKPVNIFAKRNQVLDYAIAITEIYRDNGARDRRTRARLKFMMDDWGPEKFREEIARRVPFKPLPASGHALREAHHDHLGVHPQKAEGMNYIGITVTVGRVTGDQLFALADIADSYGSGRLANTISQNIILFDIPDDKVEAAVQEIRAAGLTVDPVSVRSDCVVCTGKEFCNLAVTETKALMKTAIDFLEKEVNWDSRIRIHMTGCPNNCGQQVISDIGLQGAQVKIGDETLECYDFHVGGGLGEEASFVRKVARRISPEEVPSAIANLVKAYQQTRTDGQTFKKWTEQHSDEEIASLLGAQDIKLRSQAAV